jgi:hypothetical protein
VVYKVFILCVFKQMEESFGARGRDDLGRSLTAVGASAENWAEELTAESPSSEAPYCVRLSAGQFHDFGERRTLRPPHQVDHFRFLAAFADSVSPLFGGRSFATLGGRCILDLVPLVWNGANLVSIGPKSRARLGYSSCDKRR